MALVGGAGGFSQGMKKTLTQMPTLFPFILKFLNGTERIVKIHFSSPDIAFWWCTLIRNASITLEAINFSKIPSVNVRCIIVGLYYQNSTTTWV